MGYFATSTLHPDLRSPEAQTALAAHWQDGRALRLAPVLDPGLAAELAVVCGEMELIPRQFDGHADVSWSAEVSAPEQPDPQMPECLFRLIRFLRQDMPELVSAITGRSLVPAELTNFHLWSLRKGSYVDDGKPLAPEGGLDVFLGLTGATWPVEWGGHIQWRSDRGVEFALPPGMDTLDILDGGQFRVPLVRRHVRTLAVRSTLGPERG